MRILMTADFHGNVEAFRKTALKAAGCKADAVVLCGDITHFGSLVEARELLSHLFGTRCPMLFVPGNCDPRALADERIEAMESIHKRCRQIGVIDFLGVGGSNPSPFDTPFEIQEREIAAILERGFDLCHPEHRSILVSHSPPKGTKVDMALAGDHVGSSSVRSFIEETKPLMVLCGHIHEARGVDNVNDTIVVNPGPARDGHCALIDLNKDAKVMLSRL